jgi:hypothetical protein
MALTRDDLVLAAVTKNGERNEGPITESDLASIASWLDYVNHDGSTGQGVRDDLLRLAKAGRISLEEGRFRLLYPWP